MSGSQARQARRRGERQQATQSRPFPRRQPGEHLDYRMTCGVTVDEPEGLVSMMNTTHDGLIAQLGDRRRSGVTWHFEKGIEKASAWLANAYADMPEMSNYVDVYLKFFTDHPEQGVLVVAYCEARRVTGPTSPAWTGQRDRVDAVASLAHRPQLCTTCRAVATKRLTLSTGGLPWHACAKHLAQLSAAILIGVPGATSGGAWVDVDKLAAR